MEESKNYNRQLEINDLIDDAISNAVTRRGLVENLSDDEAASVGGGLEVANPMIAGFKPIDPVCPPTKPPIKPTCPPTKPPIKPICPPIVVGIIYSPKDDLPIA
jgi:hypothetical protein